MAMHGMAGRLSGKAILSLILGLLVPVGWILAGLPALLLGFAGLREINQSDDRLRGLIARFLGHCFVLGGLVFRRGLPLLRSTFAPHRGVIHPISGRLLAPAEQPVEESHLALQFLVGNTLRTRQYEALWVEYGLPRGGGTASRRPAPKKNAKAGEPEGSSALARPAYAA